MSARHALRRWCMPGALALVAAAVTVTPAHAQGGRRGDTRGGAPDPTLADRPTGVDMSKRVEEMYSLKELLKHVDGLEGGQKDSLKAIEGLYKPRFKEQGEELRKLLSRARATGQQPDMEEMRRLTGAARQLHQEETAAARAVLTTDEQRQRFDANLAEWQEKQRPQGRRRPG